MSADFPTAMSPEALQELMDKAPSDKENLSKLDAPFGGYTRDQMIDLVDEAKDALMEKINDPFCHKMMAMLILDHFIAWHEDVSTRLAVHSVKEHETGLALTATGWAEDLGKLKIARNIIADVNIGENDFMSTCDCCDNDDD